MLFQQCVHPVEHDVQRVDIRQRCNPEMIAVGRIETATWCDQDMLFLEKLLREGAIVESLCEPFVELDECIHGAHRILQAQVFA